MHPELAAIPIGRGRAERARFWRSGLPPYEGDRHHVVPLLMDCHARWHPEHPFFRHAETQHFVLTGPGRHDGRIAATVDRANDALGEAHVGLFGWFECTQSPKRAECLLDAAAAWLRERGCTRMRGPVSYTTNGLSGLLVEDNHPGPPTLDMPYNPPWYAELLEGWGLEKAQDLVSLRLDVGAAPDPRHVRVTDRALARGGFSIRHVRADTAGFAADVEHVLRIYNGAWEQNWGFVPLTAGEIRHEAKTLKSVLVPELMLFVEKDGEPVAFSLTLPDLNQALRTIRGRLWPWSVVRFLRARKQIDHVRVITLGVLPEFRRNGLDMALIVRTHLAAYPRGVRSAECGWVLDDNDAMISAIRRVGGEISRTYRVYERDLSH